MVADLAPRLKRSWFGLLGFALTSAVLGWYAYLVAWETYNEPNPAFFPC
jgi:hypothetical protein